MDNLTHTLAGLLAAEVWVRRRRALEPEPRFVRAAYLVSALANNLPDFDFVYVRVVDGKLGYLMHHRGHTHTFALALPLALLALGIFWVTWARRSERPFTRSEWGELAALALAGPLLHVGMDFSNSYGVHPFWPFDSRWVYGDAVFIVEPLFWMAALPALFFATRVRLGRILLGLWLLVTAILPLASGMVALPFALLVSVGTLGLSVLAARVSARARAAIALGVSLFVLATFVTAASLARSRLRRAHEARFPAETVRDLVLSPMPANPTCWQAFTVSTSKDAYVVRRARVALAPSWVRASDCTFREEDGNAGLEPLGLREAVGTSEILFESELGKLRGELGMLARSSCHLAAFLRFARVPYWRPDPAGGLLVGDLRFDRDRELGFAELVVPLDGARCPDFIPGWRPPRHDLLDPSAGRSDSRPGSAAAAAATPGTP